MVLGAIYPLSARPSLPPCPILRYISLCVRHLPIFFLILNLLHLLWLVLIFLDYLLKIKRLLGHNCEDSPTCLYSAVIRGLNISGCSLESSLHFPGYICFTSPTYILQPPYQLYDTGGKVDENAWIANSRYICANKRFTGRRGWVFKCNNDP